MLKRGWLPPYIQNSPTITVNGTIMKISNIDQRDILTYAFRYALGRQSYAPSTVADIIINNWDYLSDGDKMLYKREILQCDNLGMDFDRDNWMRIIDLK